MIQDDLFCNIPEGIHENEGEEREGLLSSISETREEVGLSKYFMDLNMSILSMKDSVYKVKVMEGQVSSAPFSMLDMGMVNEFRMGFEGIIRSMFEGFKKVILENRGGMVRTSNSNTMSNIYHNDMSRSNSIIRNSSSSMSTLDGRMITMGQSMPRPLEQQMVNNSEDTEIRYRPARDVLLNRGGMVGASAVFLADSFRDGLRGMMGKGGSKGGGKGGGGLMSEIIGEGVGTSIGKYLLPLSVKWLPAVAGVVAFSALKWDDITGAFKNFKEGKIFQGIENFFIGDRRKVKESNAGKGIGKQGLAWGLGVGGIKAGLAGATALAGGASVGSAVLTGLAAAFPPALIAVGVAGLAKGIQTAWVLEWDKRAEDAGDNLKSVFKDENSTWWDKTKASFVFLGKGIMGTFAGGLRNYTSNITNAWKSTEGGFWKKLGSGLLASFDLTKIFSGGMKTLGDYINQILPQGLQDKIKSFKEMMTNMVNKLWERLANAFLKPFHQLQQFFSGGNKNENNEVRTETSEEQKKGIFGGWFQGNRHNNPANDMKNVSTTTIDNSVVNSSELNSMENNGMNEEMLGKVVIGIEALIEETKKGQNISIEASGVVGGDSGIDFNTLRGE